MRASPETSGMAPCHCLSAVGHRNLVIEILKTEFACLTLAEAMVILRPMKFLASLASVVRVVVID